jgi:hypothetical protein
MTTKALQSEPRRARRLLLLFKVHLGLKENLDLKEGGG